MNQAGLVAVAFVGLWIAYLMPHRLRFQQQLLEARTEDRFSDELRVVRVASASRSPQPVGTGALRRTMRPEPVAEDLPRGVSRPYLHPPGRGWDGTMHRPHGAADRITADAARHAAAERARRVAHLARRRAAARRRALLTLVLLVGTVVGWGAVGAASASLVAGFAPTAALLATLALGRRAVVAGRGADAAWAVRARELAVLPGAGRRSTGVVGRAVHPSEARTEVMARVGGAPARRRVAVAARSVTEADRPRDAAPATGGGARGAETAQAAATAGAGPQATTVRSAQATGAGPAAEPVETWVPVPVPRPTYTLKPEARRAEPAPLVLDDERPAGEHHETQHDESSHHATGHEAGLHGASLHESERDEQTAGTVRRDARASGLPTGGQALDAVLARRRAAGA